VHHFAWVKAACRPDDLGLGLEGKGARWKADAHITIIIDSPITRIALTLQENFHFIVVPEDYRAFKA